MPKMYSVPPVSSELIWAPQGIRERHKRPYDSQETEKLPQEVGFAHLTLLEGEKNSNVSNQAFEYRL